jgi:hypothetical protein
MTPRRARSTPSAVQLRRGALAVSVLHDIDLEPNRQGVRLTGKPGVWVPWSEVRDALGGHDPESDLGRLRLATHLSARRWVLDHPLDDLRERLRPVGLPVDHVLHPGEDWVRARVLGGALDLGLGAVGLDHNEPDRVVLLPQAALEAAGLGSTWDEPAALLERMGALAARRHPIDRRGTLRPIGDCDVVTLLGSFALRERLAEDAGGLAVVVAPMRRRGWTQLALADPVFAPAAWVATDESDRGFARPVLVTADEVELAQDRGGALELLMREPVHADPWQREVLYR